jgi:hypothetical protein
MKQPQTLEEAFKQVTEELEKMFIRKNLDYGKGNILDTGELGICYRVNDKVNRLRNLIQNSKKPTNESVEETWIDIAVYSIIAVMYKRKWFQNLELSNKKNSK